MLGTKTKNRQSKCNNNANSFLFWLTFSMLTLARSRESAHTVVVATSSLTNSVGLRFVCLCFN